MVALSLLSEQTWYIVGMISSSKTLETNILVEKDISGGFIVSIPGINGAHADGKTLEQATKNLNEVMSLLKEYYGDKKFRNVLKEENRFLGVMPYSFVS